MIGILNFILVDCERKQDPILDLLGVPSVVFLPSFWWIMKGNRILFWFTWGPLCGILTFMLVDSERKQDPILVYLGAPLWYSYLHSGGFWKKTGSYSGFARCYFWSLCVTSWFHLYRQPVLKPKILILIKLAQEESRFYAAAWTFGFKTFEKENLLMRNIDDTAHICEYGIPINIFFTLDNTNFPTKGLNWNKNVLI